ncbi:MAG: AraC family transcriptional regulator [Kiritimatiellales bacterium]
MDIIDFINSGGRLRKMQKSPSFISKQVSSREYYYLNLTPQKNDRETVVCGGREQCAPDYRVERSRFKFCSLEFVSAGKGILTLHKKTWPLRPGAIYFYGSHTPHCIETDSSAPMIKHFVDFSGSGLTALVKRTGLYKTPIYTTNILRVRTLFNMLLKTGVTESRHRDELCVLLLKQLLLYADETAMPQQEAFSQARQTFQQCRLYIEQNFQTLTGIEQIATACHIDKAYLCRLFKRYADETPLQFLTRLKMNRAAALLLRPEVLIKQVAEKSGYSDPCHFSRVFKRIYDIPPETFIQTARRT